jgi:N-acetylmuramoyl-L-alanine amidase
MGSDHALRAAVRAAAALVLLATGCAHPPPPPPQPTPAGGEAPKLPPIPFRSGPLKLGVIHPPEGGLVGVRDSTFIFGSTGSGAASLRINGTPVPVAPNGAFLAFLPVPPDGRYTLVAMAGVDTARLVRQVRILPPLAPLPQGKAVILPDSITPRGGWTALPGERIDVAFSGTPGGEAALVLPDGRRIPLVEEPVYTEPTEGERAFSTEPERLEQHRVRGRSRYRGYFAAEPLVTTAPNVPPPTLALLPPTAGGATLELVVGTDTARAPLPLNLALADPERPTIAVANPAQPPNGTGLLVGRPGPSYTYYQFWPRGTRLTLTGERDGEYRVTLTPDREAWVAPAEVRRLPEGTPPPAGAIGTVRMSPTPRSIDVRIATAERFPFRVDAAERTLVLTIYGGTADTDWLQYGPLDPLIRLAEWREPERGVYQLVLHLTQAVWGYRTLWANNGDLILRVRRPPTIDPSHPLRGLVVAVDAGHPPAGAIGPTGLTEPQANLAIALRLRPLLEAAGARVVMTRTTEAPLSLPARTNMAIEANADLLISVHNNAFPDGVNPFVNNGTSVYYNHPQSLDLARSLLRSLLDELGLRDLGVGRGDLALVRPTWMPAVLTETMYMLVPQQEAALRDPSVQERIARAHRRGIEEFLRRYARENQGR